MPLKKNLRWGPPPMSPPWVGPGKLLHKYGARATLGRTCPVSILQFPMDKCVRSFTKPDFSEDRTTRLYSQHLRHTWCDPLKLALDWLVNYSSHLQSISVVLRMSWTSQVALVVKNPPANAGDMRDVNSTPGSERYPGGGYGNPLQYCLKNPLERGAWWATVHRVSKSWTWPKWLSLHAYKDVMVHSRTGLGHILPYLVSSLDQWSKTSKTLSPQTQLATSVVVPEDTRVIVGSLTRNQHPDCCISNNSSLCLVDIN